MFDVWSWATVSLCATKCFMSKVPRQQASQSQDCTLPFTACRVCVALCGGRSQGDTQDCGPAVSPDNINCGQRMWHCSGRCHVTILLGPLSRARLLLAGLQPHSWASVGLGMSHEARTSDGPSLVGGPAAAVGVGRDPREMDMPSPPLAHLSWNPTLQASALQLSPAPPISQGARGSGSPDQEDCMLVLGKAAGLTFTC